MNLPGIIAWILMGLGAGLVIMARVDGIHLTEGEQLIEYGGVYFLAVACVIIGYVMMPGRRT